MSIETIGTIVRGQYGELARIVEVLEHTRMSANHVSAPSAVVVKLEPVGPSFGHRSSWSHDLTPAEPGDVGAHPCHNSYGWRYVGASWRGGDRARQACETCKRADVLAAA